METASIVHSLRTSLIAHGRFLHESNWNLSTSQLRTRLHNLQCARSHRIDGAGVPIALASTAFAESTTLAASSGVAAMYSVDFSIDITY